MVGWSGWCAFAHVVLLLWALVVKLGGGAAVICWWKFWTGVGRRFLVWLGTVGCSGGSLVPVSRLVLLVGDVVVLTRPLGVVVFGI